jgi:lipoprotein-releasing system ATP-binding protein
MKELLLKTKSINKYFYEPSKFHVLKDINLEVNKGEFVTLVGKSGCGKSTLMYVLSTMDTDYTGALHINDVLLTGKNQNYLARFRNEHIGFVFQFHYLLPEFTCLQNIMIPALKLSKFSKQEIEERAYEKLKILGIEEQALKQANKLSGGQQQRVAIARAMINDPAIIMGDEPTGNLDSKNSDNVMDIFKDLVSNFNQTLILVTHDEEIAEQSDRVIEMSDGKIIGKHRKGEMVI